MQTINTNGKLLNISKPIIAGILNITPDSFFDGGKYTNINAVRNRIKQIISEGAEIIDIGAYSSRPGAKHISEKEELQRLIPVLELIVKDFSNTIISLDTFRSEIAKIAVNNYEVAIINDISAGNIDKKMLPTIAKLNVPYIMMHMKGTPKNMQKNPKYKDLIKEIIKFFAEKIQHTRQLGVNDVIIDPGFGFGKTIEHNYQILNELEKFRILDCPILVGISRKSMIYKVLNSSPKDALSASLALNMTALEKGANILRVHDVKETMQVISVFKKLKKIDKKRTIGKD